MKSSYHILKNISRRNTITSLGTMSSSTYNESVSLSVPIPHLYLIFHLLSNELLGLYWYKTEFPSVLGPTIKQKLKRAGDKVILIRTLSETQHEIRSAKRWYIGACNKEASYFLVRKVSGKNSDWPNWITSLSLNELLALDWAWHSQVAHGHGKCIYFQKKEGL